MDTTLLLLFGCHCIGDYAFQPSWFRDKHQSWELNLYHAAAYTAAFVVFARVGWLVAGILLASHFIIDPLKGRWHIVKAVWQDQLLHALVIVALWYWLM